MMMANYTVRHPIRRWFMAVKRLFKDALTIVNPIASTCLACGGAALVVYSGSFRSFRPAVQIYATFALTLWVAITAVVTGGSWLADDGLGARRRHLHSALRIALRVLTCGFLICLGKITFIDQDYSLATGLGILAIQIQYFIYLLGYIVNLGVLPVLVGFAGAVLIRETEGAYLSCIILCGGFLMSFT